MYLRYFGFESFPFAVTPDPAFLYLSASHREALAHLLYGAGEHGGFVSLIGEVGTGKTTLIRAVVDSDLSNLDIALCWNPHLDVTEFLATICDELGVMPARPADASLKLLVDRLNAHLLAAHADNRRTVLIVDEAQNLSRDVLEQLRLLTNLETHTQKLLRIILVGQPELATLLARHDLRQLAQRITARFVLRPLGYADTRAYVLHRLQCANGPEHLFSKSATTVLRGLTGGVPRLINMVCDRALMGAYAHGRSYVGAWTVLRAGWETLPFRSKERLGGWWRVALPSIVAVFALVMLLMAGLPGLPLGDVDQWIHAQTTATTRVSAKTDPPSTTNTAIGKDQPVAVPVKSDAHAGSSGQDSESNTMASSGSASPSATTGPSSQGAPSGSTKIPAPTTVSAGPASNTATSQNAATGESADASGSSQTDEASAGGTPPTQAAAMLPKGNADMNQLLRLWGVFGSQVRSGCQKLQVGDLHCLDGQGDLAMLRRFNRPALVNVTAGGTNQVLLLTKLSKDKATLVGTNGARNVSLAQFKSLWGGHYRIVWRSEAGERLIQPNSVGHGVVWLRRRLETIAGKNPDSQAGQPSPVYDDALGHRLKAFQTTHGLSPDGIAGPKTQMVLNGAVASPGTPELAAAQQSRSS